MTDTTHTGTAEHVVLPPGGRSTLTFPAGEITLSATDDLEGRVRVDFGAAVQGVMLRVTELLELHDGDLIAAGSQWLSFERGVDRPARLHLLNETGATQMTLTLRGTSLSLGRSTGDVVLPQDDALSELHLQLLVREHGVYLQDLGSTNGTWTVVRPGEVLPSGSTLAVGHRMLRVSAPPASRGSAAVEQPWRPGVYVAA